MQRLPRSTWNVSWRRRAPLSAPPALPPYAPPKTAGEAQARGQRGGRGGGAVRERHRLAPAQRHQAGELWGAGLGWGARSLRLASACLGGLLPCSNPLFLTLPSHPPSTQARRDRVAAKFVEAEFEKCDRLLEAYLRHEGRVAAEEERCAESCLGGTCVFLGRLLLACVSAHALSSSSLVPQHAPLLAGWRRRRVRRGRWTRTICCWPAWTPGSTRCSR